MTNGQDEEYEKCQFKQAHLTHTPVIINRLPPVRKSFTQDDVISE